MVTYLEVEDLIHEMQSSGMTNPHNVDKLLCGDKIVTVDSVKDLGIIMNSELKFSKHIGNIVARAHARANLIHKCFLFRDDKLLHVPSLLMSTLC